VRGYVKAGGYFVGAFGYFIANCNQFGARNVATSKQVGMASSNAPTPQQAKPDHPPTHLTKTHMVFVVQDLAHYRALTQLFCRRAMPKSWNCPTPPSFALTPLWTKSIICQMVARKSRSTTRHKCPIDEQNRVPVCLRPRTRWEFAAVGLVDVDRNRFRQHVSLDERFIPYAAGIGF
jgi:hypothetical protein